MWDIFYHFVYFLIQKSVNILQIHYILSASLSQITSWKLICCYKNIIEPKKRGFGILIGLLIKI